MKTEQSSWSQTNGWKFSEGSLENKAQIIFVFGAKSVLEKHEVMADLLKHYPDATAIGCSTAGEIQDTQVSDNSIVATAAYFENTNIKIASLPVSGSTSRATGKQLAEQIGGEDLTHVLVFSEGLNINGSELVIGLRSNLPSTVGLSGGLAGDGGAFKETCVVSNGEVLTNSIVAVGFYGSKIKIASASLGGWDSFGPVRKITKAHENILYELDGQSALDLYKTYLGEHSANLPASGLLFPLSINENESSRGLVRTILGVNEVDRSITFAGDLPLGWSARLMKANFDRLVDGAIGAAEAATKSMLLETELAILISCVGRKMVLGQRVEEEVEGIRDVLGKNSTITGFYSYGEISPFTPNAQCELHNQTMTITVFSEDMS